MESSLPAIGKSWYEGDGRTKFNASGKYTERNHTTLVGISRTRSIRTELPGTRTGPSTYTTYPADIPARAITQYHPKRRSTSWGVVFGFSRVTAAKTQKNMAAG